MLTKDTFLRRCIFRPYAKGKGPAFTLVTWDGPRRTDHRDAIGYRLTMIEGRKRTVLFEGEDFGNAPGHSTDGDESIEGIMTFLTLRPGDTDADYFANYTDAQRAYCASHAEALSTEISFRYQCFECGGNAAHVRTVDGYRRKVCDSHRRAR